MGHQRQLQQPCPPLLSHPLLSPGRLCRIRRPSHTRCRTLQHLPHARSDLQKIIFQMLVKMYLHRATRVLGARRQGCLPRGVPYQCQRHHAEGSGERLQTWRGRGRAEKGDRGVRQALGFPARAVTRPRILLLSLCRSP